MRKKVEILIDHDLEGSTQSEGHGTRTTRPNLGLRLSFESTDFESTDFESTDSESTEWPEISISWYSRVATFFGA